MTHHQHHRPALIYRRKHRIRQRRQTRFELELLRAVAAALRDLDGVDGTGLVLV